MEVITLVFSNIHVRSFLYMYKIYTVHYSQKFKEHFDIMIFRGARVVSNSLQVKSIVF